MDENKFLRDKVRLLIGLQRIQQKEFAEYLEISPDSFWSWYRGYYNFGKEKQTRLNDYIGLVSEIDLDRLIDFYGSYQFAEDEKIVPIDEPWSKGRYYCSNYGTIISLCHSQWKELTQTLDNDNQYYYVSFSVDGQRKKIYTHRLVAQYFVPNDNPEEKTIVHHIDGMRHNSNHANNLMWVSPAEHYKIHNEILKQKNQETMQNLKE